MIARDSVTEINFAHVCFTTLHVAMYDTNRLPHVGGFRDHLGHSIFDRRQGGREKREEKREAGEGVIGDEREAQRENCTGLYLKYIY